MVMRTMWTNHQEEIGDKSDHSPVHPSQERRNVVAQGLR